MTPPWVHPSLLSALCVVEDSSDNPWLRPGTHLRVFPTPAVGFPICPFTVWRAGIATKDRPPLLTSPGDRLLTGIGSDELAVGAWAGDGPLSILDAGGREAGRCSRPQPMVARLPMTGFRHGGSATAGTVSYNGSLLTDDRAIDAIGAPLPVRDGAPCAWWSGISPDFRSADGKHRVQSGDPDVRPQPYDSRQPRDTFGRALALATHLEERVEEVWRMPMTGSPPAAAGLAPTFTGERNTVAQATLPLTLALWSAAADSASARWWGFATTLPVTTAMNEESSECFAVAALFVPAPGMSPEQRRLLDEAVSHPLAAGFTDRLYVEHANLRDLADALRQAGHQVVCLWTIAVATPPPDLPGSPLAAPLPGRTAWDSDESWRGTLGVRRGDGGPLAVLRVPGTPVNPPVALGEPWRQPIVASQVAADRTLVTFTDTVTGTQPAGWDIATADLWGQWSPFGAAAADPPPRPSMPKPTPALEHRPADPVPTGTAPVSPGELRIRATLPQPPVGAPAITSVEAALDGTAPGEAQLLLTAEEFGVWTGRAAIAPTAPGGAVTVTATLTARDASDRTTSAVATLVVHDPRPFVARALSQVMLFSGERRPDGYAELDLDIKWDPPSDAPPGTSWRLYAADEQLPPGLPAPDKSRWSRADPLRDIVKAETDRTRMARLTAAILVADNGDLRIRCRLPGRLESIQALQLVPVTKSGLEAPARECGCFVVAVPLGDAPPAPVLTRTVDPLGTTVKLTVSVSYPGTRSDDDAPPLPVTRRGGSAETALPARLRRSAAGADPATWPLLVTLQLKPRHPADRTEGWCWTRDFEDVLPTTTPAWTPLSYVCEAAWPDEPALNPGTDPEPSPVHPHWPRLTGGQPGLWSERSAVLTVLAPRPTPAVVPALTVADDGTAALTVAVPAAHPRAQPWTLAASAPGPPPVAASVTGVGPELRLDGLPGSVPPAQWLVALTTPDGRMLPMVRGDGTPP